MASIAAPIAILPTDCAGLRDGDHVLSAHLRAGRLDDALLTRASA